MSGSEATGSLDLARACWQSRDLLGAKQHIEVALQRDLTGLELARVRIAAGIIYREIGDAHMARDQLTALVDNWDDYPEARPLMEGTALYNLALVHRQRKDYDSSLSCLRLAMTEFRREGMERSLVWSMHNAAWSLCLLNRTDEAVSLLDEAHQYVNESDPEAYWHQRIGYVHTCYCAGDYQDALELASDILTINAAGPDVLSQAAWLAGLCGLQMGSLDAALKLADIATDFALQAKDTRCMNDAGALKRACIEAQGLGA